MTFQIQALSPEPFARYFAMAEEELARHGGRRMVVTAFPGTPCRVSLADAEIGETVVLVNHEHQPADTPYRSRHAIYVREGVARAEPAPGEVPASLRTRLISLRQFGADHMMIDADVVAGADLGPAIERAFADPAVSYLHLHYAKQGCFAARAERA